MDAHHEHKRETDIAMLSHVGPALFEDCWGTIAFRYPAGDTRPTQTLTDLANLRHGSDVLLLQNMGPILDFAGLPKTSQYLLNVRSPRLSPESFIRMLHAITCCVPSCTCNGALQHYLSCGACQGHYTAATHVTSCSASPVLTGRAV